MGRVGSSRPQSGPWAAGSSEAGQMPAASRPSHAPFSSALLPAPVSVRFSSQSSLERETHPRRDPLRCSASSQLRRSHALPLGSNLQASMAGRPPRMAGRVEAAWGARGPGGRRAAQRLAARAAPAGRLCSRRARRVRRASSPPPLGRVPGIGNNVELAARAPSVASLAPLALSLTHRAPASPQLAP